MCRGRSVLAEEAGACPGERSWGVGLSPAPFKTRADCSSALDPGLQTRARSKTPAWWGLNFRPLLAEMFQNSTETPSSVPSWGGHRGPGQAAVSRSLETRPTRAGHVEQGAGAGGRDPEGPRHPAPSDPATVHCHTSLPLRSPSAGPALLDMDPEAAPPANRHSPATGWREAFGSTKGREKNQFSNTSSRSDLLKLIQK